MRRVWQQYPLGVTFEQTANVFDTTTNNSTTAILMRPVMPPHYQKEFKYGIDELRFEVIENDEKVIYTFDESGEIRATSSTKEIVWRSRPSFNHVLKIFKGIRTYIRFHGNGALEFTYWGHRHYYFGPYVPGKTFENYKEIEVEPSYKSSDDD